MKAIFTFCIGVLLPLLLISQNLNPKSSYTFRKPILVVNNKNKVFDKLLTVYNDYAEQNKLNKGQSIAVLSNKQKLDSIIIIPTDTTFTSHKSAFTYNTNGNITSSAEYDWDKATQNWFYSTKKEWSYNTSHYNISYTTYYGDQKTWFNELKYDNTYDVKGRLTNVLGYGWNDATSQWDIGLKIENTFDDVGRDTTSITYEWDGTNSKWNPTSKVEYDYNNDSLILTHFVWTTKWVYSEKEEITYYVFGPEHVYTYYQWDGSGIWANFYQATASYDANRKLSNFSENVWDVISVIWVNSKKTDYRYTGVDTNMVQDINSKYVKQLQGFVPDSRDSCFYQNKYRYEDLLLPPNLKFTITLPRNPDNNVYFNHMLTKNINYIYNGTAYINNNIKTFYYSPIVVSKTNQSTSDLNFQLVPNPASDFFTIVSDFNKSIEFNLFDINGKLKISKKIHCNELVSTQDLSKGMYLYRIISNDKIMQSGKLILD